MHEFPYKESTFGLCEFWADFDQEIERQYLEKVSNLPLYIFRMTEKREVNSSMRIFDDKTAFSIMFCRK